MKYFTPERWLRLQDVSTEDAFHSAQADWQAALKGYVGELGRVMPHLPLALQEFARSASLHDGVLDGSWYTESPAPVLRLHVRPQGEFDELVELVYHLDAPPVVKQGVIPPEWAASYPGWMYDEIGMEHGAFTHDILLRDGVEIGVRFSRFTFERVKPLLPSVLVTSES